MSSAEATHMSSVAITAEGRVGKTGVDEEGTEEQGAAQAAELLKMFDIHVGHFGSTPSTLASFIQTHDQLDEQQREAAQAKALLQRRVSMAVSRSAQIDKLLDDAIMEYLSEPKVVEEKPSILEEIAGAFRSNFDPVSSFSEHPFIVRYRSEQAHNAVLPPRLVQQQLLDTLLKNAPGNMKMAVIHANLDAPGTRDLKIQQDLICMKKTLMDMKKADMDAEGREGDIKVFIDVTGVTANKERVLKEIQKKLEDVHQIYALNKLGDEATQNYAVGLADFVYRIGEGELAESHNIDMATFKTEALRRGGIVRADVSKSPAEMCTIDHGKIDASTGKTYQKFHTINMMVKKVEQAEKEKKMLSETEQWARQQRRVEHNKKRHGKAVVDVDINPANMFRSFTNFLHGKGKKEEKAAAYDSGVSPSKRRGANYGLYKSI